MKVYKATSNDHNNLTSLMRNSKSYWGYEQKLMDKWQDELTITKEFIENNHVFKIVVKSVIVGFFAYSTIESLARLQSMFILPNKIGKGLGAFMMDTFLDELKEGPVDFIVLESDPNAEGFYKNFGFKTVSLKPTIVKKRFMPIMVKHLDVPKKGISYIFETVRIIVREFNIEDLIDFYDMQRNPNVMRYIKKHMNIEESIKELEKFISYYDRSDELFRIWAAIEKNTNQFIGLCGVYLNERSEYEIAYRLREKFWGQGLGKELTKQLLFYCLNILNYEEVVAYIHKENFGSIKIAQQLMQFHAISKESDEYKFIGKRN
ncbi:MAG: GNAT family N-acetyltransferase [Fulvivirga sp.]|uniref:GNAT family N-acetyltransferase n=1 Tax=Fulvivirga sp. TaxID=1931237 RepID=UPI0032ED8FB1